MEENVVSTQDALSKVIKHGVPAMISMFFLIFMEVLSNSFIGHLGKEDILAGVGMANMYLNIICLSLILGMNSTLNTLLTQAYGYGDFRQCGVYLNRSRIIMTCIFVPLSIFLLHTDTLFIYMGFDASASYHGQEYLTALLPGIYFLSMFDSNKRFLNGMGYQNGPMII